MERVFRSFKAEWVPTVGYMTTQEAPSRVPEQSQGQMLISLRKLLQQQTDPVRVRILSLNAPDSAGFQWFPLKRKKDPKVLFAIAVEFQ